MHFNSSEAALAGWMSSSWAAFATSDDPNGAKLPVQWPQRSAKNEQPINFNLYASGRRGELCACFRLCMPACLCAS